MRNSSVEEILDGVLTVDNLLDMHHIIFMGDMNYRCTFNKKTPADIVRSTSIEAATNKRTDKGADRKCNGNGNDEDEDEDRSQPVSDVESDQEEGLGVDKKQRQAEMTRLYDMITEEKW